MTYEANFPNTQNSSKTDKKKASIPKKKSTGDEEKIHRRGNARG